MAVHLTVVAGHDNDDGWMDGLRLCVRVRGAREPNWIGRVCVAVNGDGRETRPRSAVAAAVAVTVAVAVAVAVAVDVDIDVHVRQDGGSGDAIFNYSAGPLIE